MYFEMCDDGWDDDDGWDEEGWFEIDCVDLVYPISIVNPEGDIISVESEDSLHEYIDQYLAENNDRSVAGFTTSTKTRPLIVAK